MSILHMCYSLCIAWRRLMQQAQANPSARVASCPPTGYSQRRVDLGFFMDPSR